jgi:hypothetical protein
MKKLLRYGLFSILTISLFTQCKKSPSARYEMIQIPKVISLADMRSLPVGITKAQTATKTGKIYIYNDYLFINEPNKGIHIYNNANPSNPVNISFLQIPGNIDLAVHNNILYADSYIDLLAFDISSINNIKLVKRTPEVFKQYLIQYAAGPKVLTYKDTLVNITANNIKEDAAFISVSANSYSSSGKGGSMARFTLLNDYLYTVGINDLSLFNVQAAANPTFVKSIRLDWGVETIFPYEQKLFIGTNTGMHIFNAADPANPVKLSTYAHVFACDPVVVQGKYAYVTLRAGTGCRQATNQLEVLDIEDPTKPKQVAVFPMQNPHGLSVSGNNLFLCEGDFGLKSFNISDKSKIGNNLLQHLKSIKSYDVIAGPKSLIVTGDDGVYQFNYQNTSKLNQLSKIKIQNPLNSSFLR